MISSDCGGRKLGLEGRRFFLGPLSKEPNISLPVYRWSKAVAERGKWPQRGWTSIDGHGPGFPGIPRETRYPQIPFRFNEVKLNLVLWISQLDEVALYWFVACLDWVRKTFWESHKVWFSVTRGPTPQKEGKKLLRCRKVFWMHSTRACFAFITMGMKELQRKLLKRIIVREVFLGSSCRTCSCFSHHDAQSAGDQSYPWGKPDPQTKLFSGERVFRSLGLGYPTTLNFKPLLRNDEGKSSVLNLGTSEASRCHTR